MKILFNYTWVSVVVSAAAALFCTAPSMAQSPATNPPVKQMPSLKSDDDFVGKYEMTLLIPREKAETARSEAGNEDEEGDEDEYKSKWILRLYQDRTYYLNLESVQNGKVYYTEHGRGEWARNGNILTITDGTKNDKKPMFTPGFSLRWSKTAQQHADYYNAQLADATAWKAVRERCPFWTANSLSYGVAAAVSDDNITAKRSLDEAALLSVKKLADDQVNEAINRFIATTPNTPQWNAASQYVEDAYNRQNDAYASMAITLQAAGKEQYEMIRNVPKHCGAPENQGPSSNDYDFSNDDNTQEAPLPDSAVPKGQVGVIVRDPNFNSILRDTNITATLKDGAVLKAMTDETGWAFFKLPNGKTIVSLTVELERDENGPDLKTVIPVSISDTQVQDIFFDQLRAKRPIFNKLILVIDGEDLMFNMENITGRFVRDQIGEVIE
jgi:hypothetical protein